MKKKSFLVVTLIILVILACKKEQKSAPSEILGTWSLYSDQTIWGSINLMSTSTEYPCMSNVKLIFNADGTYASPPSSKCFISPSDSSGHVRWIGPGNRTVGKWSITGNTVTTTRFDTSSNKQVSYQLTLTNVNGKLQLKGVDSGYLVLDTRIFFKAQ